MVHIAICTEDGHVYSVGKGKWHWQLGQLVLGNGDNEQKTAPAAWVQVQALKGKHITQVQCGRGYTLALTSSGYAMS
jgi:alpha-tubulin suppressor-like RCC1 family protein